MNSAADQGRETENVRPRQDGCQASDVVRREAVCATQTLRADRKPETRRAVDPTLA